MPQYVLCAYLWFFNISILDITEFAKSMLVSLKQIHLIGVSKA